MGYEVKIYIGKCANLYPTDDDGEFFLPIAMVDLCKPGESMIGALSQSTSDTPIYFYGEDGNTAITEDRYGKRLTKIDYKAAVDALYHDIRRDKYWRFPLAIAMLEKVREGYQGDDLAVMLYGY